MKERGLAPRLIVLLVVGLIGAGIGAYIISQSKEGTSSETSGIVLGFQDNALGVIHSWDEDIVFVGTTLKNTRDETVGIKDVEFIHKISGTTWIGNFTTYNEKIVLAPGELINMTGHNSGILWKDLEVGESYKVKVKMTGEIGDEYITENISGWHTVFGGEI